MECILRDILNNANGDVKKAERGIIYIDEIDKTSRKGENLSTTADPGHEGVQQALLKLLEGSEIEVPEKGRRIHPENTNTTKINTENILFVLGGAFEGIEKIIAKRLREAGGNSTLGFGSELVDKNNEKYNDYIERVSTEDLKKFGMLPELLGRVPVLAPLRELTEDEMIRVLTEPRNAIVKQYQRLLEHDGVTLEFTKSALKQIANEAIKRKTGARALRGIMEGILNPVMFSLPDRKENVVTVDEIDGEIKITYDTAKGAKRA